MHSADTLMLLAAALMVLITFMVMMFVQHLGLPPMLEALTATILAIAITMYAFLKISGLDGPLYNK